MGIFCPSPRKGSFQARQTFTTSLINTLQVGSDALTNADQNTGGASLLALQTRQSLGVTALSLASALRSGLFMVVQQWRHLYNHIRTHTSLGYRPSAQENSNLKPGLDS